MNHFLRCIKSNVSLSSLCLQTLAVSRSGECAGWKRMVLPHSIIHELEDLLGFMPQQWDTPISEFFKMATTSFPHWVEGDSRVTEL